MVRTSSIILPCLVGLALRTLPWAKMCYALLFVHHAFEWQSLWMHHQRGGIQKRSWYRWIGEGSSSSFPGVRPLDWLIDWRLGGATAQWWKLKKQSNLLFFAFQRHSELNQLRWNLAHKCIPWVYKLLGLLRHTIFGQDQGDMMGTGALQSWKFGFKNCSFSAVLQYFLSLPLSFSFSPIPLFHSHASTYPVLSFSTLFNPPLPFLTLPIPFSLPFSLPFPVELFSPILFFPSLFPSALGYTHVDSVAAARRCSGFLVVIVINYTQGTTI